jgi:NADH dehydrogenase
MRWCFARRPTPCSCAIASSRHSRAHIRQREAARRAWLTFVVIGGGETGTELAATIDDFAQHALEKAYPWLVDEPVRVVLIEFADRLVPLSSQDALRRVRALLERRGITVYTGVGVDRIDADAVHAGERTIPARTAYWAAGVSPPDLVRNIAAEHAKNGALLVDEQLRVRGRPDAYAIGDNAWAVDSLTGQPVPALAQAAEHEADYVARAIVAGLRGAPLDPFRFKKLGQMTLLGRYEAVAEIGPLTFTGPLAWLLWHAYYASRSARGGRALISLRAG